MPRLMFITHPIPRTGHGSTPHNRPRPAGGFWKPGVSTAVGFAAALLITVSAVSASPSGSDPPLQYNRDIRPILAEHCFACHGTDEHARKAGLRLDLRDAAIEYGAIDEEGGSEASEMIARLHSDDEDLVMPPPETGKVLSDEAKETLARWIDQGALYERHWSLEPIASIEPPIVDRDDWQTNPIDAFVLDRLRVEGVEPAKPAEPHVLLRRLHLDITGLPPSPQDAAEFSVAYAADPDAAVGQWVDRLMDTPAYGEHRARYWLDAARYADTHGMHFDNYREIWPYRDWVIRAMNSNQPMDQFYVDQLAGDLVDEPSNDQLIATGFLRCNMTTNEGGTIDEENLALYASDRVQTFGWVFLGLTTNCAQCHDHKFDDFSARDYYALSAFFRNMETPAKDGNNYAGDGPTMLVPSREDAHVLASINAEIQAVEGRHDANAAAAESRLANWQSAVTSRTFDRHEHIGLPDVHQPAAIVAPMNAAFGPTLAGRWSQRATQVLRNDPKFVTDDWFGNTGRTTALLPNDAGIQIRDLPTQTLDQPVSVSFWTNMPSNYGDPTFVARCDTTGGDTGWEVSKLRRQIRFSVFNDNQKLIEVSSRDDVLVKNTWQHVSVTYDPVAGGTGVSMYLDGQCISTRVLANEPVGLAGQVTIGGPLEIGRREGGSNFGGKLHDVQFGDAVWSPWQIRRTKALAGVERALASLSQTPDRNVQSDPALTAEQAAEPTPDEAAATAAADRQTIADFYVTFVDVEASQTASALATLRGDRQTIVSRSATTHVAREMQGPAKTNLLMRGEYDNVGDEVLAASPAALHPFPEDAPRNRLGLARWVVDPANPLTPRVTVNRFWQEIFGQGLVATPEDFGVTGAPPTHPELLDFLARDFVLGGWDIKRLFRMMLTSQTYRQSAAATDEKVDADPTNTLLSRGPRFRMDAEMIRDSALSISGLLSDEMFGPGVRPYQPDNLWEVVGLPEGDTRFYVRDEGDKLYRRTIYSFWKRMAPPPSMETFGAPNREVCTVRRERTNTPLQALVTLNDEQFVETARVLATEVLQSIAADQSGLAIDDESIDAAAAIGAIGQRLLTRQWSPQELAIITDNLDAYRDHYQTHPDDAEQLIAVGEVSAAANIAPITLATWTMLCNQLMNLDEVLCK